MAHDIPIQHPGPDPDPDELERLLELEAARRPLTTFRVFTRILVIATLIAGSWILVGLIAAAFYWLALQGWNLVAP